MLGEIGYTVAAEAASVDEALPPEDESDIQARRDETNIFIIFLGVDMSQPRKAHDHQANPTTAEDRPRT
jgi:hypothetical protein